MEPELAPHRALSISLSLKGHTVKAFTLDKPVITVGRDPDSDICIDNPGVSREHLRISRAASGLYEVIDMGTANGSLLNEEPLLGCVPLCDGDRLVIGKFTLTTQYEPEHHPSAEAVAHAEFGDQRTTVLSKEDLAKVLKLHQEAGAGPPPPAPALEVVRPAVDGVTRPEGKQVSMGAAIAWSISTFLLGLVVGVLFVLHRLS